MATDVEALLVRIDATTETLRREMRRAEQEVGASSRKMEQSLGRIDQSMERLNRTAGLVRNALGLFGVGLSLQGLRSLTTGALQAADALTNTANRVALNVEALQELRYAASLVGVESGTLEMAMQRLTRRLGEAAQGGGVLKDVLEQYGIAARDAQGRTRATEDVLADLADAIAGAESEAEQLRIAFKSFDSEGAVLVNMLRGGSAELRRHRREAHELGLVMSRDTTEAASQLNTQLGTLFKTIRTQLSEGLLRGLTSDMEDLSEIAKDKSFHAGLQAIGGLIGFFSGQVKGVISDFGRFVKLLRDPSFEKLYDFSADYIERATFGAWSPAPYGQLQMERMLEVSEKLAAARQKLAELEQADYMPNMTQRLASARHEVAELEGELTGLQSAFDPMNDAAQETAVVLGTISVTASNLGRTLDKEAAKVAARWKEQHEQLRATNEALRRVIAAYGEGPVAVARMEQELQLLTQTQSLSTDFSQEQRAALIALMKQQQDYADQIEHLQRLQDLDGQLELLQAELRLVGETAGARREALTVLEAEIRLKQQGVELSSRQAQEELRRVRQMAQTRRAIDEQTQALEAQRAAFESLVNDTVRYGSEVFADFYRRTSGGWREMWRNMRDTMRAALMRMAAEAALRPIVVTVLGALGVAGGAGAAQAAGLDGGGILDSLLGLGQQASSLAGGGLFSGGLFAEGGALAGVGGFLNAPLFHTATGAIEAGTGAMALAPGISLGGLLGAAGLGYMGGGLLAQLTGGNAMYGGMGGAGGAALGAAIGSAIPGVGTVLGGLLGGLLGGGLGSLLGGNEKQKIQPRSYAPGAGRGVETPLRNFGTRSKRFDGGSLTQAVLQTDEAIAALLSERAIQQVRDYFTEVRSVFGKTRDNKKLGDKHLRRFLRDAYSPVIRALGGAEAAAAFGEMTSGMKPDKVLEIAQEVAVFLGRLHDETLFQTEEISELEAAHRALTAQYEDFRAMAEKLGQSVALVDEQFRKAQETFAAEIEKGYQNQIDAVLRPAEQAWRQLREAQEKEIKELEKIGVSTARAQQWHQLQIRALFEQNYELQRMYLEGLIDLGEDLNAQLGALWGIVSSGIGSLIQGSSAAYQEAVRLGRQYAQVNRSLQQTLQGLRIGPQSPLSLEQQLALALEQFRATLGEALAGDSDAATQLQQLVNPVLDLARQFFGATEGYAQLFEEVLRGLEMAGIAMETRAAGFAGMAAALEAQTAILQEISDTLARRDELGADFETRYDRLTSELEAVGYTIGGINAFLQDAADAIPATIVTAFASGLDSAQLAKRMGELFQATVTATEEAMRAGVEDMTGAIADAQQALLRGWIPDFIELAEQFNGTIPEIRFDRVTARVVAHYEASANQLGQGVRKAVAQVQFDGLEQAIYTVQEIVGRKFDAAIGGISFEGIDGTLLAGVIYDGITGIAQAAQVSLVGQAERIEGVIEETLEAFTLDAARATITDSVDIINRGATRVQLAFGRVEGALLRLSNNADGHIVALIDEVDTTIARFTNWGAGSLRVGVNNLRARLLDVRNAGEGALLLFADTVEANETRISNLDAGSLVARINNLRTDLLSIRSAGQGVLLFWADEVRAKRVDITSLDEGMLIARINRLRTDLLNIRAAGESRILVWANEVKVRRTQIAEIDAGNIATNINALREQLTNTRNVSQNKLGDWSNRVNNQLDRIRDIDAGNIGANADQLRGRLLTTRNTAQNRLANWANHVQNQLNRITDISNDLGGGSIAAELKKIVQNRLPQRFKEAIDRAFGNVFDTAKPTEFFKNMDKLVGANSELVTSLRELNRTMLLLARKDQIDAFSSSIGDRAAKAMRVSSLQGAREKLNADQGWENQGHSYARINYSASKGFTMGATHKSGGSGSSQLNKMKTRAQELMDQLNHLVSVNKIAIDPSKLPSTLELNSRKGSASAQQIFDDLIKRGAVVARVDDPNDNMLKRMAREMQRLVGGTLPSYGANYLVRNGRLEMDLWVGDRSLTRTGSQLTNLTDIAGQFLQMLKYEMKVSSAIEPLLRAIDFRPAGLGPQGGLEQLARSLMEHGLGSSNVPKFASGGYHAGGLAIVGERGPELVDFASPSRIYSAPDTSRIMAAFANDNGSFRELIAEVRALRAENAELRRTVSEGFGDTVQAEGQSGLALRTELRALREDVEDLQSAVRQQARRQAS